jgi:hypothetical protein
MQGYNTFFIREFPLPDKYHIIYHDKKADEIEINPVAKEVSHGK